MIVINDVLNYSNLKIYQDTDMFNFSLDSILLPNFVTLSSKTKKILDIGTGNAIIPIILSTKINAQIDAVEIQKAVYKLGKDSIYLNNLQNQINIINDDIKNYYKECESDVYDTITCNPPFFKFKDTNKINKNDYKTIARHEVLLDIEDVIVISKKLLKNNGNLAIVHRTERFIDIICLMRKYNIEPKKVRFVYPKKNKDSNIVLIEGIKNGKPGMKILPPLYSHTNEDEYTEDIKNYFKDG